MMRHCAAHRPAAREEHRFQRVEIGDRETTSIPSSCAQAANAAVIACTWTVGSSHHQLWPVIGRTKADPSNHGERRCL